MRGVVEVSERNDNMERRCNCSSPLHMMPSFRIHMQFDTDPQQNSKRYRLVSKAVCQATAIVTDHGCLELEGSSFE